jgi:hypothetical protein
LPDLLLILENNTQKEERLREKKDNVLKKIFFLKVLLVGVAGCGIS